MMSGFEFSLYVLAAVVVLAWLAVVYCTRLRRQARQRPVGQSVAITVVPTHGKPHPDGLLSMADQPGLLDVPPYATPSDVFWFRTRREQPPYRVQPPRIIPRG